MQKLLLSACLIGQKVRYDGGDCFQSHPLLQTWFKEGRIVTICPEMAGGLTTPRPPAEKLQGHIITNIGINVSEQFQKGAERALALCQKHNIQFALLKAKSPSCGNTQIYDGTFTRTLIQGQGVTAKLLSKNGIRVFNENEIDELAQLIQ